jgi:hypothetical protein
MPDAVVGLHAAGHEPSEARAITLRQAVTIAQDAQPAGSIRRRGPAVSDATGVAGEGDELPGDMGQVPSW